MSKFMSGYICQELSKKVSLEKWAAFIFSRIFGHFQNFKNWKK